MRTLLIGALAATLIGCSRQPPPQTAIGSCTVVNGFACHEQTAGPPIELASSRIHSAATDSKSVGARKTEMASSARHRARLASKIAKPTTIPAKAEPPASRTSPPIGSSNTPLKSAGSAANATDSKTTRGDVAVAHPTVGIARSDTRMIEAQVAAATVLAERVTAATAAPLPGTKAKNMNGSGRPDGNAEERAPAVVNDMDLLVAILMVRPDVKSLSDLTGKNIAIDERYSASNGRVRIALVAAGAFEVQLSEGQTTAVSRLANGEVPAAVLALVSANAAEGFPEIAGFKIFRVPLSPRSLEAPP